MNTSKVHLLAIAAHPDDIELGCGGTLLLHTAKGQKVAIIDLTRGELGTRGTPELRSQEAKNAAAILGVQERINLGFEDGFFANDKAHLLTLTETLRYYQPEIVIANALEDRHPDHGRAGKLIADACFLSGLVKIKTQWEGSDQEAWRPKRVLHMIQDRMVEPSFIVDISSAIDKKMEAIKAFKSQFHNPDSKEPITYIATDAFIEQIKSRSSQLGKRIGVAHGEGFVCENTPGIADLDKLLLPTLA